MTILRPGQRILNIPGIGVTTSRRAVASAAADWWAVTGKTCVGAYQAIRMASLAASKVNRANPGTHDAVPLAADPAFNTTIGWTWSGQSFLTGITPASGWSALCQFSGGSAQDYAMFGSLGSGNTRFFVFPHYSDNNRYYGNGGQVGVSGGADSGNIGFAGQQGYRDGSSDGGAIAAWSGTGAEIRIGGYLQGGSSFYWSGVMQAIAFWSGTLTAGEVATVSAAMAAL